MNWGHWWAAETPRHWEELGALVYTGDSEGHWEALGALVCTEGAGWQWEELGTLGGTGLHWGALDCTGRY